MLKKSPYPANILKGNVLYRNYLGFLIKKNP